MSYYVIANTSTASLFDGPFLLKSYCGYEDVHDAESAIPEIVKNYMKDCVEFLAENEPVSSDLYAGYSYTKETDVIMEAGNTCNGAYTIHGIYSGDNLLAVLMILPLENLKHKGDCNAKNSCSCGGSCSSGGRS